MDRAAADAAGGAAMSGLAGDVASPPGDPFAGRSILDLEDERVRLENERESLSNHPSRTDTWQQALQRIDARLTQVCAEIGRAGSQVVPDAEGAAWHG